MEKREECARRTDPIRLRRRHRGRRLRACRRRGARFFLFALLERPKNHPAPRGPRRTGRPRETAPRPGALACGDGPRICPRGAVSGRGEKSFPLFLLKVRGRKNTLILLLARSAFFQRPPPKKKTANPPRRRVLPSRVRVARPLVLRRRARAAESGGGGRGGEEGDFFSSFFSFFPFFLEGQGRVPRPGPLRLRRRRRRR